MAIDRKFGNLPSVDAVLELLDREVHPLQAVPTPLADALGCVLAEPVCADRNHPACDVSSIDGYATGVAEPGTRLKLAGEILPGNEPPAQIAPGEAWRIFTGAPVPADAALVMVEDAAESGERVDFRDAPSIGLIRRGGSSTQRGATVLAAPAMLSAGAISVLAAAGVARPLVIPRPRVAHITTGREIVSADQPATTWQIRDSNSPLIRALVQTAGADFAGHIHVDEAKKALVDAVTALPPFDVLLVSGGSSVGKYDNTAAALEALGFQILVRRVNVRPGKPLVIARRGAQWAFGLPGNPLSHFASFHLFVHRALCRLAGRAPVPFRQAKFTGSDLISAHPRETFHPARIDYGNGNCLPAAAQILWADSGDLSVLARANGFLRVPAGQALAPGACVEILPALSAF